MYPQVYDFRKEHPQGTMLRLWHGQETVPQLSSFTGIAFKPDVNRTGFMSEVRLPPGLRPAAAHSTSRLQLMPGMSRQ